ncbi:MAG: division/cell wall cluster transcriptional repressor MraZ [Zoogloeaceae bacterium]|jgi:MraZ protein|nr:division/cell wall cluster transcriptional repressor MraZ [Zoogloeaceae bacterium]
MFDGFEGSDAVNLDAKGRFAIPTRHREALAAQGEALVLTAHPDHCLLLYPVPAWEPIREKILKAPSFDPRSQNLKRVLVGNARTDTLDASGRLLLPPGLRGHAQLEKTIWVVGMGSYFEIWSEAGWQRVNALASEAWDSSQNNAPPPGFEDISL